MTDLPAIRDELVAALLPDAADPAHAAHGRRRHDVKTAWRLFDGAIVECVLMRYPNRITICISSQAGCGMNCPFCATGQAGLTRNMSAAEIVEQVVRGARLLRSGELAGRADSCRTRTPSGAGAELDDEHDAYARDDGRRPGRGHRPDPDLQRRLHGHGRGAGQLQGRDRRDPPAGRPDARTAWACPPAASPCRPSGLVPAIDKLAARASR